MGRQSITFLILTLSCVGIAAAEAPDPFGVIIDAARHSVETSKHPEATEPPRSVTALPKSLQWPHPEPGPARTALHAHIGPDGRVVYDCRTLHAQKGEEQE